MTGTIGPLSSVVGGQGNKLQRSSQIVARSEIVPAMSGSGVALDEETRGFMEPRFGFDFSRVRIHDSSEAANTARSVGSRAFTLGTDIVFGVGQYAPKTSDGQRLLAHELAHVVQQRGVVSRLSRSPMVPPAAPAPSPVTANGKVYSSEKAKEVLTSPHA